MISVPRKFSKYLAFLDIQMRSDMAHWPNIAGRIFSVLLRIWVISQLYRASLGGDITSTISGMTVGKLVWSVALVQCFGAVGSAPDRRISEEIRDGTLAYSLIKPCSYVLRQLFSFFGQVVATLPLCLLLGVLFTWSLVGGFEISAQAIFYSAALFLLGLIIHFLISICIGLLGFWVEDVSAFVWIYHKSWIVFGGMIIPIDIFPDGIRELVLKLPFAQIYYGASQMLVNFNGARLVELFLLQLFWYGVFLVVASLLFARGIRNLSINGG